MKVMLANKTHAPQAAAIFKDAYLNYFKSVGGAKARVMECVKTGTCYVAVEDKKVLGIMCYSKSFYFAHNACSLDDIAVHKDHRKQGVARALIGKFTQLALKTQPKNQKWALSSTNASNKTSIKMHKKLGFVILGRIKYLHFGEDEIIFGYKLC